MKLVQSIKRSRTVSGTSIAHQTSSSAHIIAGNDDLLTQILLRLPIKSLLKFKSVSKHWLSLISNPHFSRYRNSYPNSASGLFVHRSSRLIPEFDFIPLADDENSDRAPFKSLSFVNDSSGIEILQSCNGLLCCCSYGGNDAKRDYYIYNPTTKQFTTLPKLRRRGGVFGVNLAFDPSKSPHYKVVCVRNCDLPRRKYQYQIEIYSSEMGPWRVSGDPFIAHVNTNFRGGVFWNGAIHWICPWETSLCFDVDEERLREMPMPRIPDGWDKRRFRYFGESRDHLHLVEIYGPHTAQFNVYEMERDYSGWIVKYRVDLDVVKTAFPEIIRTYLDPSNLHYYAFVILCLVRGETDEESFVVLHIPGKAIRYNLIDKTYKKLCDFAPGRIHFEGSLAFGWFDAFQYIECLSCV